MILYYKAKGVNDSPGGLLSTYSLLLLVVFFLQSAGRSITIIVITIIITIITIIIITITITIIISTYIYIYIYL